MGMNVRRLMGRFDIEGQCTGARRFGNGHLQDTRLVTMRTEEGDKEIVLQGINTKIFPRVRKLMENMVRATDHLREALQARPPMGRREVLQLIPAKDGKYWVRDHLGGWWRATWRIQNASSVSVATGPGQVASAAKAFGELLRLCENLRPHHLHEVIMRFHDLQARLAAFEAVVSADTAKRASSVRGEIIFVRSRTGMVKNLPSLRAPAGLPVRVTHNDTKLNNVLLDDETGEGVCVIDLDTMMPGLSLYDFGDMIRTMASPAAEDETDLSKVRMDMDLFEKAATAWLAEAGPLLGETEIKMLPHSVPAMTFMIGVRFLTDHLQGDTYFNIDRPNQNLDRARAQFALVESMEKQVEAMKDVVQSAVEI